MLVITRPVMASEGFAFSGVGAESTGGGHWVAPLAIVGWSAHFSPSYSSFANWIADIAVGHPE